MRRIALHDLEAFTIVAHYRSFRRAALERRVSASLLSQTLRRLEEQLGVTLMRRTTRSVALTEAGEYLYTSIGPVFAELDDILAGLNRFRSTSAGSIRINAPMPVVQFVLAPLASAFLQQHPDMHIELSSDAGMTDIVSAGFDAGVRFDDELAQDMVAVPIAAPQRYCVVASPAYLAVRGRPADPEGLSIHSCIQQRFPGGSIFAWHFTRQGVLRKHHPRGALTVTDGFSALLAARDGAGIAYVHEQYARPDIAAGSLVELLSDWEPCIGRPYLYYPRQRQMAPALRLFIDFAKSIATAGTV